MKLKFLAAKEAVRVSPNGTAEVSFTNDVNHGFVFPDFNFAKKGLILNPNVLMWPAKAVVANVRDVAVNIAEGEIVGIRVEEFGPAEMEELGNLEADEVEAPVSPDEVEAPVNPDEIQDPMDEGNPEGSEESTEAPATEDSEAAEEVEETPKKKSRKSK